MEALGLRKAEMTDMSPDGKGRVRIDFMVPSRGLIGFQTRIHDTNVRYGFGLPRV